MVTDRHPKSYLYLSSRLLKQMYHTYEAYSPGLKLKSFKQLGLTFEGKGELTVDNLINLARIASEQASDHVGTVAAPGHYVRTITPLNCTALPNHNMAWMYTKHESDGVATFIGLAGSIGNYVGYSAKEFHGWHPSSLYGIKSRLSRGLLEEPGNVSKAFDSDALTNMINDSQKIPEELLVAADTLEVMCEVLIYEPAPVDNFDYVLLGAPVWVGSPPPKAITW